MKIDTATFLLIMATILFATLLIAECSEPAIVDVIAEEISHYAYPNYNLEQLRAVSKESGLTGYVGGVIEELEVTVFVYIKED